jgi:hypothetical protein
MMSSPSDEAEGGDWHAALTALQRLHARLAMEADTLRVVLACPTAPWDGEVTGLSWGTDGLPEAKRAELYASVSADLQRLGVLTEKLAKLAELLEARGPTEPP